MLQEAGRRLRLEFLPNRAGPGSWMVRRSDIRAARSHAREIGCRVVGLFHSHPLSGACLGSRDLRSTPINWIHLVYDVCEREMKLWRVTRLNRRRVAHPVPLSIEPRTHDRL